MHEILDLFLRVDQHLTVFVAVHGGLVYALLFTIVFLETGVVIMPFLPGDSLLFAAGAVAATGALDVYVTAGVLFVAAVLGDAVNYATGRHIGPRVLRREGGTGWLERRLNRAHLDRTRAFFEAHGGKAVVLARFVPIVRTFVPFLAGASTMSYARFAHYNVLGAALWVAVCTGGGYLFGAIPVVKENFELAIVGVIAISAMPLVFEYLLRGRSSGMRGNSAHVP